MKKITDYNEILKLTTAQLRPRVLTNAMLTREEYEPEIAAGRLLVREFPEGLLLFLQREGYYRLYFYLQQGGCLPVIAEDLPVVCELPSRGGAELPKQNGSLLLERQRMRREPQPWLPGGAAVRRGTAEDLAVCRRLLKRHFHPLAGCLPDEEELLRDLEQGALYLAGEEGLLHLREHRGILEIRHLAVEEQARNKGIAQSLLYAALGSRAESPCRVWVRQGNTPAIRFYEKNGFMPDRMTSRVYLFEEKGSIK